MVDFVPGRAVIDDAQRKRGKYMAKCAAIGYGFLPFSFSSLGELEADAVTLLKRIQKFSMTQDIKARADVHIFNRISFAIAKGVGDQIVYWLLSNLLKIPRTCSSVADWLRYQSGTLRWFLQELGFKQQRYAVLCDNQSTIHLAKNSMFHKRTKHIDIRYHWIRDAIEDGMFELNKVHTDDNASDMLTKAVAREKLKICCSFAGMANSSL
ncbi:hypothetical protein Tco_1016234 [Tanacetum coccineum]|uniref:Uncharacterized protein n=1 Tax=Tanacetum coccineum TaxID=301880 RepID=A0ABQ5FNJ3_9ASTR